MTKSKESKSTASQPASPTKLGYLTVTEASMKDALIEARGDIFIASQLLQITAIRLDRAIQVSHLLQACIATLNALVGVSNEAIQSAIDRRSAMYRVAGLDALHDLATMPIDVNSAQNQVKLAAAARLAGETASAGGGGELVETLRELNAQYQSEAPRLRVTRERLTIETLPQERIVGEGG